MKKGEGGSVLLDLANNPTRTSGLNDDREGSLLPKNSSVCPAPTRPIPYNVPSTSGEHTMNYRRFGRTGWNVSEIGYGMWGLAGWTGSDDGASLGALQRRGDFG